MITGRRAVAASFGGASETGLGVRIARRLLEDGLEGGFGLHDPIQSKQGQAEVQPGIDVSRALGQNPLQAVHGLGVAAGPAISHGGVIKGPRILLDLRRDLNQDGERWQHGLLHRARRPERGECVATALPE